MLYDANVNSFTVSRHDFPSLTGAYAASAFGNTWWARTILNASLVPVATINTQGSEPSGFTFVGPERLHDFLHRHQQLPASSSSESGHRRRDSTHRMVESPAAGQRASDRHGGNGLHHHQQRHRQPGGLPDRV